MPFYSCQTFKIGILSITAKVKYFKNRFLLMTDVFSLEADILLQTFKEKTKILQPTMICFDQTCFVK